MSEQKTCDHSKTVMWEPHLAGARKCLDCEMVYNPNHAEPWHFEPKPDHVLLREAKAEIARLKDIALRHVTLQQEAVDERDTARKQLSLAVNQRDRYICELLVDKGNASETILECDEVLQKLGSSE